MTILKIATANLWLFAIRSDDTIWQADSTEVPLNWVAVPYGGTGIPVDLTAGTYPGPVGQSRVFILADDDTLWSFTYETGEWLQRVPVPAP
jgi:hypothetical protein